MDAAFSGKPVPAERDLSGEPAEGGLARSGIVGLLSEDSDEVLTAFQALKAAYYRALDVQEESPTASRGAD